MGALRWINLSFLVLYPISWTAPLAYAGFLPFFRGNELTIAGGIRDLWHTDMVLAMIVATLAVVAPFFKTLLLSAALFGVLQSKRAMMLIIIAGKLSMADVFLIAVYIVVIKGVGVGHVTVGWGLYLFTAITLTSLFIAYAQSKRVQA
ncbi:MAG: paraquat-inducible protein A [Pikeienuella sp.]